MKIIVRKATERDIDSVTGIYDKVHTQEEAGLVTIGWDRSIYPTRETAQMALERDDLFVLEEDGKVVASALINQIQMPAYADVDWKYEARDEEVCVIHTLVVLPEASGRGLAKEFVKFYEEYAVENGWHCLRMDTNERNARARSLYKKLGYLESGIIPTVFNGISGVNLVCLEKKV